MERRQENLTKYLKDQMTLRYAMYDRPTDGSSNLIIDSFAPKMMMIEGNRAQSEVSSLPSTSYAISEWFASTLQVRQLPFSMMLQTLNMSDKDLKKMILAVKRKKLNFCMVGAGGTNNNTWYWLGKILEHTGDVNLFDKVWIYDKETVDFTNLFRFPSNPEKEGFSLKVHALDNRNGISKRAIEYHEKYLEIEERSRTFLTTHDDISEAFIYQLLPNENYNADRDVKSDEFGNLTIEEKSELASSNVYIKKPIDNMVYYGAPDLETRRQFTDSGWNFISATHGDNDCSLRLKPMIDQNLQTESYGMIQLTSFFFNQLAMTIGLLEFLSKDEVDVDNVNKWETPGSVFEFNFKDFINGNLHGKADRQLSFQVNHDGLMEDENAVSE